ncbi:MAG: excinuclease ABC subunit UvrC [Candidatus Omnitrophota bacterium]
MVAKEKIKNFPDAPGVYLMKDGKGRVIYVGKALSLKKRVRSYFLRSQPSVKTQIMLSYCRAIGHIATPSEHDALIMEADLIKQYKPRFNISLKDDKSYPYIKITKEDLPRVFIGRRKKSAENVDHFGPYTSSNLLRRALTILRKSFPFCTCRKFPKKVCLNYHMGLCAGPYQKKISKRAYRDIIKALGDFLTKRDSDLIDDLSLKMRDLVRAEKFEEAARLRDSLEALSILVSLKKTNAGLSPDIMDDLEALGLDKEPARIEAFDISDIGGSLAVGSMVSFHNGKPDKGNYRRFKIKTVSGSDDYAMIREVVRRRYVRLVMEFAQKPDLIVIDGGLGHLEAARCVLKALDLKLPIIAIAKSEELIYTVKHKNPVKLSADSGIFRVIQRARDEAHRFALKYHHLLRTKHAFRKDQADGF